MEKDEKRNDLESKSSTISKNKKELRMVVDSKKLKVGSLFHIEAVDEEEGILHKYTLRNVQIFDQYDELQKAKKKTIDISLNTSEKEGSVTTSFDPNWLIKSTFLYNHELARFNMALASVAYCEDDGNEYGTLRNKNYYDALTALGFKVDGGEYCLKLALDDKGRPTKKEDPQTIHYYLASNKYKIEDEAVDVVILTLRGTKGNEWYDNFDIDLHNTGKGKGKNCLVHDGFNNGASAVKKVLKEYIRVNNLTSNTKIIITGHSRGAAVTNLLAAQLGKDNNEIIGREGDKHKADVFAYAYACPNTVARTETQKKNYDNIFNFVNPQDFVTKVVPSKWGFGRYGRTLVFFDKIKDNKLMNIKAEEASKYKKAMLENLAQYWKGSKYEDYSNGMQNVSDFITTITDSVNNVENYYIKDLTGRHDGLHFVTLYDVFYDTLANYMVEGSKRYIILGMLYQYAGSIGNELAMFFVENNNGVWSHRFEYSHTYETYLAMLNAIEEFDLVAQKKMINGIINCPVDVEIYNFNNKLVGRIRNNEIDTSVDSCGEVELKVIGDSKQFKINASLDYKIKLIGNADGKMDYILATEDLDAGEEQRVLFKDISIFNKKTMEMNISSDVSLKDQILKDERGKEIHYDELLQQEDLNTLSVTTEVEGIGNATSFANLTYGDAVVLKAETDENNKFIGWYDEEGKFLSKELMYPVIVTESKTYHARFTDCIVPLQNYKVPDVVQMEIGATTILTVETIPDNATIKNYIIESMDNDIVQVDNHGVLQAKKSGTAKIKVSSQDGRIVCYTLIVVGKVTPMPSVNPGTTAKPTPRLETSPEPIMPTPCVPSIPIVPEKSSPIPSVSAYPMEPESIQGETNVSVTTNQELTPTANKGKRKKNEKYNLLRIRIKRIKRKKKGIYIEFTKVKKAIKYEIQWSMKKTFKKEKIITLKKNKYLIKCKKKKLYIRIRAIGRKIKGRWTKIGNSK